MKSQSTKSKDKKKNEWASWNITNKMWYITKTEKRKKYCILLWLVPKNVQRQATHHHVLYVVGTHPSPSGHGSERRVQAVHMEQERTVITLDQRSHPAAPIEEEERETWCTVQQYWPQCDSIWVSWVLKFWVSVILILLIYILIQYLQTSWMSFYCYIFRLHFNFSINFSNSIIKSMSFSLVLKIFLFIFHLKNSHFTFSNFSTSTLSFSLKMFKLTKMIFMLTISTPFWK